MADFELQQRTVAEERKRREATRGRRYVTPSPHALRSHREYLVRLEKEGRINLMQGILRLTSLSTDSLLALDSAVATPGVLQPYLARGLAHFITNFRGEGWLNDWLEFADEEPMKNFSDMGIVLDSTRAALGVSSLKAEVSPRYGRGAVLAVLRTGLALRSLMLERQAKLMKPDMGYGGVDEWADRVESVRFMTPRVARLVLERSHSPEALAEMIWSRSGTGLTLDGIDRTRFVAILSTDSAI